MTGHSFKALADAEHPRPGRTARRRRLGLAVAGVLAATAVVNHQLARRAERRNPPVGQFIEVDGIRLHYLERGEGSPLVLLHGNGSMIQDFVSSGLVDLAARRHRVIVFDRPGYGHSPRPRGRVWSPQAQADLFQAALGRLGVSQAVILGHSWGASVALAMALNHPQMVRGLVLASGYYFPTARVDMALLSGPAVPLLGDVARHTVAPIASRLIWPLLMRKIFGPAPVPEKFRAFPEEMAVRPSQIRAEAAESALLIPSAAAMCKDYASLTMPVAIVAGAQDRLIDPAAQSQRLHQAIAQSSLHLVPGCGHMVHQTSPGAVMAAIDTVGARGV
ncbi:alpha/beta hydrolase [Paracoccus sp. WLY502]|uniref:alpha/beta fold hydrolase n=1 Tax=Paracoccus yibinensis TaxID=3068891 RepID=UPI002796B35E|nr:alpha/beta hydrolase [Paracoccus sp. WLY502]MDQ1902265.1 alpha/beta hydrolase [Paracoccus sp. WLY502]